MSKLRKAEIRAIEDKQREVLFYGTEEKGYTDSGLWKYLPHVYTKDSHDPLNPVKRIIGEDDTYALIVFLYMLACNDLCIPKSRQIRMSWFSCAFAVWHTKTAAYRHTIYQTKKEEDAFAQTSQGYKNPADGRMDFIEQHMPSWLKDPNIASGKGNLMGSMTLNPEPSIFGVKNIWRGSKINAVPQGGNQVRQYTPSLIVSDESAFQDEYASSRIAAKPAVTGGGKFISVSSVDSGSAFNKTVLDIPGEPRHEIHPSVQKALDIWGLEWPKGMRSWQTRSGVWVLEVHYTADPKKDPARNGEAWVQEALKGYVGGRESSGWQTEMEINYGAGGGDPVFPQLTVGCPVFIDGFRPDDIKGRMRFYAGYDYGARNPSAFAVWGIDDDDNRFAVWELYEPCTNLSDHIRKLKACPYYDRIEMIMCDPSIASRTQQGASDIKSLLDLFQDQGFYMTPGRRGQDVAFAQLMNSIYWGDPENPRAFITKACPSGMKEILNLRWDRHISEVVGSRKNNPEKIRDKDNHWIDASAVLFDVPLVPFTREINEPDGYTFKKAMDDAVVTHNRSQKTPGGIYFV